MAPMPDDLLQEVDWVRTLAARLVFDAEQRADLEQEIWHATLRRPAADGVPLRAWLTGIARHLAAMLHRGGTRRQRREAAVARSDDSPSTVEVVARAEQQQRLLAAVNALPAAMRDVVLLRWLEGLPPRAISRRLGVPVATVRTRQQRALASLRERLDADYGDRRTWMLAFLILPRPRDVAAAAGVVTTLTHLALTLMKAKQLVAAAAALLVLAAIPTALVLTAGGPPAPPDYHSSEPVTAVFRTTTAPSTPTGAPVAERVVTAPARTLRGRVVDGEGRPVGGAVVTKEPAWAFADRVEAGLVAASDAGAISSADGAFTLTDVGADAQGVEVSAAHAEHVARDEATPCRFGEEATIVMLRTHDVPLTVEVFERTTRVRPPRFLVTGTVFLSATGHGVAVAPMRQLTMPDAAEGRDGRWHGTARVVAGMDYQVMVRCSGHGRGWLAERLDPIPRAVLRPEPGQPLHVVLEVDFDVLERASAKVQRGRIVDAETQAPIAGVDVTGCSGSIRSWRGWRCVQSRGDGTFAIALPDEPGLALRIEHPDWQNEEREVAIDRELVVPLRPRASLTVRLVDQAAQPIAGAHALVRSRRYEHFVHRATTNDAGTISLTGLLAGDYTVYVVPHRTAADEQAITSASWTIDAGQKLAVTMPITPPDAVHVRGTVLGDDADLAPAFVPCTATGRWVEARRHGRQYDAGGMTPGDYLVVFVARNGADRSRLGTVVAVRGLGTLMLDLTLPAGTVRGRVVMTVPPSAALRVVAVPANLRGGAAELVGSDRFSRHVGVPLCADGSFELTAVADGDLVLQLRDEAKVLAQRPLTLHGTADIGDWVIPR